MDPRLGRMLIEAGKRGCTRRSSSSSLPCRSRIRRSALSTRSAQADQQHARFRAKDSDFATLHNLWRYLRTNRKPAPIHSAFRRLCRAEYPIT